METDLTTIEKQRRRELNPTVTAIVECAAHISRRVLNMHYQLEDDQPLTSAVNELRCLVERLEDDRAAWAYYLDVIGA